MVTFKDVKKAKERMKDFVKQTPLIELEDDIYLKLENKHEQINAFKARGAYNKMSCLEDGVKEVITAAVGSHGFAVGVIAKHLGIKTTCFMPESVPQEKKDKMKSLVDEVKYYGQEFSETEAEALRYAEEKGIPFVHPYNDEMVIAGQGTMGLEILEQLPEVQNIYMPVGGGGMLSGISLWMKELAPQVRLVGCQPAKMHAMAKSVEEGKITVVEKESTLAEPLSVNLNPQAITFTCVQKNADKFILVSDEELKKAMKKIYEVTGEVAEGAGAIAVAAALKDPERKGKSVCVVSGGNIDKDRFLEIIS